jgi:hypothetical protein
MISTIFVLSPPDSLASFSESAVDRFVHPSLFILDSCRFEVIENARKGAARILELFVLRAEPAF